ncbi:MAG: UDP-N-acetylmuramate dehydrogenase [Armatimonadetes bacterium]|nr:UDP-N-acetylmuramate dehydrogenase [Armatimonadota bacterium]
MEAHVPLSRCSTLRVGGRAARFLAISDGAMLADVLCAAQVARLPLLMLGGGSNVCPSDAGFDGLVVQNRCGRIEIGDAVCAETGAGLGRVFQSAAASGRSGLEFAVGIPGSVGGALVSNAGAYRSCVGDLLCGLDIAEEGRVRRVGPEWLQLGYRSSRLRAVTEPRAHLLRAWLGLGSGDPARLFRTARGYQEQRLSKQPWLPSAGSFFKNVTDAGVAARVPGLPPKFIAAGVVPAGYLSSACGCLGLRVGGAQVSPRHGNFIVNTGGATASDVRVLASLVRDRVSDAMGVRLEEEVLYVGDWPGADPGV